MIACSRFAEASVLPGVRERQLAMSQNRAEDVVEVVRDAPGHGAERFELLRFAQLLVETFAVRLSALALGDVLEHADDADRAGLAQPDHASGVFHFDVGAVGSSHPVLERIGALLVGPDAADLLENLLAIVGVDAGQPRLGVGELARGATENLLRVSAPHQLLAGEVGVVDEIAAGNHRGLVAQAPLLGGTLRGAPLLHHDRSDQRHRCGHDQEHLQIEHRAIGLHECSRERTEAAHRVPHRDGAHDHHRRALAANAPAQRRPHQERNQKVGERRHRPVGRRVARRTPSG